MEGTYNGWTNWATWNTCVYGNFESKSDIDFFRDMVEKYQSSLEEDGYLNSMTYFDQINWDELYEKVGDNGEEED